MKLLTSFHFLKKLLKHYSLDDINSGTIFQGMTLNHEAIPLIHKALVTGIRDYFAKTSFKSCIIGLSGGIDSAICLCLAVEALGNENVRALLMPSRYSSDHSVNDAVSSCRYLNVHYDIINIEKPFTAFEEVLAPLFKGKTEMLLKKIFRPG